MWFTNANNRSTASWYYPFKGNFSATLRILLTKINIQFHIDVQHIMKQKDHFTIDTNEGTFQSRQLVFATGRSEQIG